MSLQHLCDGCGAPIRGPVHTYGLVRKADYCDVCAGDVLRFVQARDALHTMIAKGWETGLANLKADFHAAHPNGRLPDA